MQNNTTAATNFELSVITALAGGTVLEAVKDQSGFGCQRKRYGKKLGDWTPRMRRLVEDMLRGIRYPAFFG